MAYTARFNFIGEPSIAKERDKFVKKWKGGKNGTTEMAKLNLWIKESNTSSCSTTCFGTVMDVIKTRTGDNEPTEIPWSDRFKTEVVDSIANYRKYVADIGNERKEFITQYDFIEYLAEVLPTYKGKICATGRFIKSFYEGKIYDNFELENVYAVSDDKPSGFEITADLFYNSECLDKTDVDTEKRLYANAYLQQYINKDEGIKFFEQNVVLDFTKATADQHKAMVRNLMQQLDVKSNELVHIPWKLKLIRGAEEVEFDESMLTDAQRAQIEVGLATIDDFKEHAYGENVYEIRFIRPILKGECINGPVESGFTLNDVKENLFMPVQPAVSLEAEIKSEDKPDDGNDEEITLESLLG